MANPTQTAKPIKSPPGFAIGVSSDQLSAHLTLVQVELGDRFVAKDEIVGELNKAGIVHGLLEEEIQRIVDSQQYDVTTLVASGAAPVAGDDALIEFLFDTSPKKSPREDGDGRIDYRDLNYIQNSSAGQVLVRKTPPTSGSPGMSVFGAQIPSTPGKDKKLPKGANTAVSADGLELTSEIEGSIVYASGVVNVHSVRTISGSIDASTGNIECNGSLKIAREVKSGFKVVVKGDLEISGHVEDAEIECEGNVIVKGGFFGSGAGRIRAKGDVTLKWIEGQTVECEGTLTVGGEVLNSKLYGKSGIVVKGSKGKIVGGEAASRFLIRAPILGSDGGATTNLRVAYDVDTIKRLKENHAELIRIGEDNVRVKEGLTALYKMEMSGKLTPERQAVLTKLEEFKKEVPTKLQELESTRESLQAKLKEIQNAVIIAESKVYAGVKVYFGLIYREIIDSMGPTKFVMDFDKVMATRYDSNSDPSADSSKASK
jgi:hypothetical protein